MSRRIVGYALVTFDAALIVAGLFLAVLLRFDGDIPPRFLRNTILAAPWVALGSVVALWFAGVHRVIWRYAGVHALLTIIRALTVTSAMLAFVNELPVERLFPRSVPVIFWMIQVVFVGGVRLLGRLKRFQARRRAPQRPASAGGKRVLVFGAGDVGETLIRDLMRSSKYDWEPVGFVDDDPTKQGRTIHGLRVLGTTLDIPRLVRTHQADEVIIAAPSVPSTLVASIFRCCQNEGIACKTLPSLGNYIESKSPLQQIREVHIEDLLGRDPVEIDMEGVRGFLKGSRVLVTGAGGSIGSELCRQIARFAPSRLIALDHDENKLCYVALDIRAETPDLDLRIVVGDVKDPTDVERAMDEHRPQVIFHAAAHKHVNLMEENPRAAVLNNVHGTRLLAEAAIRHGVRNFVLISTDKAVNPVNVMGTSKRLCEKIVTALAGVQQTTAFASVRFGNVLGSEGSVIPIFKRQIAAGGPVTVTHEEARRYFMTISEASKLVIQAGAFGQSGAVFVLDMGEQVKVIDVARQLIRLSGLEPDRDIQIKVIGLREGEKLYEELLTSSERTTMSKHQKIYIWRSEPEDWARLAPLVGELCDLARRDGGPETIRAKLAGVVPDYQPEAARGRERELQAVAARPTRAFADHEEVPAAHRPIAEAPVVAALRTLCRWSAAVPATVLVGVLAIAHLLVAPGSPVFVREPRVGRNRRAGPRRLFEREVPINRRGQDRRRRNVYGRPFSRLQFNAIPRANAGALERRYCLFLRRHRLDRIPSIFNVLAGEMALVGPRPDAPEAAEVAAELALGYGRRFTLRPGVTGLTQILVPDAGAPDEPVRRLEIDKFYVDHRSLGLDLRILTRTFAVVLAGKQEPIRLRDRLQVNTAVATRLNTVGGKP
jgi:FlaA1/EpsC-like NDP-sugar epimerase/lipopolysaccharide/colanic/teichoic acid biosynthesis glycosyltransferase